MAFNLEKLFVDVFAPIDGDVVTILCDLPHGEIRDNDAWRERREMAEGWQRQICAFAKSHGLLVNPIVTYDAAGTHSGDMPAYGMRGGERVLLEDVIRDSTIILSMTEYSSSAPLRALAMKYHYLRIAAMPQVSKSMEETGLSADLEKIAATCKRVAQLFAQSDGIEVTFSTGHTCYFDISDHKPAFEDNGLLHPGTWQGVPCFSNLPAGEVYACPNEAEDSRTCGEIPAVFDGETIVFTIQQNQVVDIQGEGPVAGEKRLQFQEEPAMCNVAEVAIGCNDRAVGRGDGLNILEDLKAGFTWAYGRSDFIDGRVGAEDFTSPDKVWHQDLVYAMGNPIHCTRFDFVLSDGTRKTAIQDGVRRVWLL